MEWLHYVPLALRSMSRNKLRTFFMMLGITIGIASLTTLASVGESTKQETMRRFKRMLGTFDTVIVRPGAGVTRGMPSLTSVEPSLTFDDARAIAAQVPSALRVAEVQNAYDLDIKYRERSSSPSVFGVSFQWTALRGDTVAEGGDIEEEDVRSLARVAVIGKDVKDTLFPDEDPIGKTIRIADVPFQVKGVLASRGAGPGGASLDNVLLIPVSTASKRLFNRDYLTMLIVQLRDPEKSDAAIAEINALLRERHGVVPPAEDDFTVTSPKATMAQVTEVGSTLSKVLVGVAIVATLIGGAVIMSLMLIAVSERRKEIGVRRAVGATKQQILQQFLVESAVISLVGGLLGVLIGAGGTAAATALQDLPPTMMWSAVGGSVVLSVVVGLVFGLQPAWRAAAVDPVEALRS
jgi:putative ABC transport system permease protein